MTVVCENIENTTSKTIREGRKKPKVFYIYPLDITEK